MNTQEQWFEPGDKVMMISDSCPSDVSAGEGRGPEMGCVYCVSDFWQDPDGMSWIRLVGFIYQPESARYEKEGELARDFRKVEEIKLCVEAAKHALKPKEVAEQPAA